MENIKNLDAKLDKFFADESKAVSMTENGRRELQRAHVAVKFLVANGISASDNGENAMKAFATLHTGTRKEEQAVLREVQSMILVNLQSARAMQEFVATESKQAKKSADKKIAQIDSVASQIMPDYVLNTYEIVKYAALSSEIKNADGDVVLDLEKLFAAVRKSASKPATIKALPTYEKAVAEKLTAIVRQNIVAFLGCAQDIAKLEKAATSKVNRKERNKTTFHSDIRKVRRENRPVNKAGEPSLPSYLDYINDDGTFVSYEDFKNTPSYKVYGEVSEEDYQRYVNSREFSQLVSILESPLSDRVVDEVPSFTIVENGADLKVAENIDDAEWDKSAVIVGEFAKEPVVLPKKEYRASRNVENETVEVTKLPSAGLSSKAKKRILAGVLALTILAAAIGLTAKHFSGNDGEEPVIEETTTPEDTTTEPQGPTFNNTEVKEDVSDIKDNPAHEITPEVDNMGENGTIIPNVPETESSEETTTPEDTTTETTESDPSYDQPDTPPAGDNGIGSDKKNETDEDEFF